MYSFYFQTTKNIHVHISILYHCWYWKQFVGKYLFRNMPFHQGFCTFNAEKKDKCIFLIKSVDICEHIFIHIGQQELLKHYQSILNVCDVHQKCGKKIISDYTS